MKLTTHFELHSQTTRLCENRPDARLVRSRKRGYHPPRRAIPDDLDLAPLNNLLL